jgi:hypothetical protein
VVGAVSNTTISSGVMGFSMHWREFFSRNLSLNFKKNVFFAIEFTINFQPTGAYLFFGVYQLNIDSDLIMDL